jgi:hypothetical protein
MESQVKANFHSGKLSVDWNEQENFSLSCELWVGTNDFNTSSCMYTKGPITWSIFNPGVELSPVYLVEISALSVIHNSIKIKRAITSQNFQPMAEFNPGDEISTLLQLAGLKFQPRG